MDLLTRIFELLDEAHMEQKQFALVLGTTDKTVSAWRTGRSKSYTKYLPQIAEALGTTTEYLLTGEGPKKKSAPAVSDSDTISEDDIKAAFWGGDKDLSQEDQDAMWGDVKRFAAFLAQQKKQEKRHD